MTKAKLYFLYLMAKLKYKKQPTINLNLKEITLQKCVGKYKGFNIYSGHVCGLFYEVSLRLYKFFLALSDDFPCK